MLGVMVMLVFAGLYVALDGPHSECGIAPAGKWPTFYNAFAFSMETMTTIGYVHSYIPTCLGGRMIG